MKIFDGLFDTAATIEVWKFLLCIGVSLVLGLVIALGYALSSRYSKSFLVTLLLLPAVVCVVIMMVNGNLGAGVAVAGAFSLVRFRSAPGSAKDICTLFLAMGAGLIAGMGYLAYAALFTLILVAVFVFVNIFGLSEARRDSVYKVLNVTIPENLDYTGVFDEIFAEYTDSAVLKRVKTTNMGSLLRLSYDVKLKDVKREKEMIDRLRVRNGNLEISLSVCDSGAVEL